ncbi:MAG: hypothetical protein ACO1RX_20165 [Candidatus Sericytochromatia bacterium]
MKIRTETLFPDFSTLIPQDGSVETIQNYTYFPDDGLCIVASEATGRLILKMERQGPDGQVLKSLNLQPGTFLRIQCVRSFQYRHVKRVTGNMVQLECSMNDDPLPGASVRRVMSYAQHYIDMRLFDQIEKGKLQCINGRYYKIDR